MMAYAVRWWMLGWWARRYVAKLGYWWLLDVRRYREQEMVPPGAFALDRVAVACTQWQSSRAPLWRIVRMQLARRAAR